VENQVRNICRGDIVICNLVESSEYILRGCRPAIILSNHKACLNSPLLNVVPITSSTTKRKLPTHVEIGVNCGLDKPSLAICEQIVTISKSKIQYVIGKCDLKTMILLKQSLDIQLGFSEAFEREEHKEEANKMLKNINELDKYLKNNYDREILAERQIALKCLENYIINHSLNMNINEILMNGCENKHGRREIS
jgi:mRNA interferase MazF